MTNDLEELCAANENGVFTLFGPDVHDELKIFFSVRRQQFPLSYYVNRLLTGSDCSHSAFVCALIYIDRISINCRMLAFTEINCHRLLATALLLAIKYIDDNSCKNGLFARVAGVQVQEINKLELTMLRLLNWRLFVPPSVFSRHEKLLIQAAINFESDSSGATQFGSDGSRNSSGEM